MADNAPNAAGTPSDDTQAPATEAAPTAAAPGTASQPDEVTTLRSRNAGLDAKVSTLMQQIAAEKAAREAAEAKALEYVSGKANENEDTRALITRLTAELDAQKKVAAAAELGRKYPESFGLFGQAIAGMPEEVLAASESRLLGIPVESHTPPVPVANNAGRTTAPANKPIEEMTLAELKAYGGSQYANLKWGDITVDG